MNKNIYTKALNFFEKNAMIIDNIYFRNLSLKISEIIPIYSEDSIFKVQSLFNENKFIKEFLGIEYKELKEKNEIYRFIKELLGYLEVRLYNLVLENPVGYLISLYRMIDYNLQITPLIMETINKDVDKNEFLDGNIRILANSIIEYKKQVNETKFKNDLRLVEHTIATDKQSLQKVVNFIISYELRYSDVNIQTSLDLDGLIELARAIYYVLSIKQEIFSNIEELSLVINEQRIITKSKKEVLNSFSGELYDFLLKGTGTNFEFNDDIKEMMKNFIGVDSIEIEKAIEKSIREEYSFPGMMFLDECGIEEFLESFFMISKDDAKKLKNELVLDRIKISKIPSDVSLKEGRLLRQSFLKLDENLYVCSEIVFTFSLAGMLADITEGIISNEKFAKKIFKYINEMHLSFEEDIKLLLESNTVHQFLRRGVQENFFKDFELPGEIDILMVINGVLFVVECKAFSLKFNLSNMLSEVKKVKGVNDKKSIQQKLKFKVETLKQNIDIVENILNVKVKRIEGIIVTKNPSIASLTNSGFYDVVHSSQILKYINNRT